MALRRMTGLLDLLDWSKIGPIECQECIRGRWTGFAWRGSEKVVVKDTLLEKLLSWLCSNLYFVTQRAILFSGILEFFGAFHYVLRCKRMLSWARSTRTHAAGFLAWPDRTMIGLWKLIVKQLLHIHTVCVEKFGRHCTRMDDPT